MVVIDIVTLVVTVVIVVVVDYLLLFGLMQAAGSRWSTKFQNNIVSSFSYGLVVLRELSRNYSLIRFVAL